MVQAQMFLLVFAFLPLSLTLVLVMLLTIIGVELVTSPYANASQTQIASPTARLYATDLLASPSPTPDMSLPVVANLEQSLKESANTEAATEGATLNEDYCVDVPVVMYHHVQPIAMAELLGHSALTVDSEIFDEQIVLVALKLLKRVAIEKRRINVRIEPVHAEQFSVCSGQCAQFA